MDVLLLAFGEDRQRLADIGEAGLVLKLVGRALPCLRFV